MKTDNLYRLSHAARLCDVPRQTLVSAVDAGKISAVRTGCGLPLVTLAAIEKWKKTEVRGGRPRSW